MTKKKAKKKAEWITLTKGGLHVYFYIHPDPAINNRFSVRREFAEGRKTPYFSVCDKFEKIRGFHDRLFQAKNKWRHVSLGSWKIPTSEQPSPTTSRAETPSKHS